jgi:methyl-accepting chemotaxis protein
MKAINNLSATAKIFVGLLISLLLLYTVSVIGLAAIAKNLEQFTFSSLFQNPYSLTILIIDLAALVIGIVFANLVGNSISKPLTQLTNSMNKLAFGDQNRNSTTRITGAITDRKDEVGAIGRAFIGISNYMIEAVEAANEIASGNISREIKPYSDKDELGNAYKEMISYLRTTVQAIAENTVSVNRSSEKLASAASVAGEATSQIAVTIQQIAKGTTEQSSSVNQTVFSVEQMSKSIDEIAKGAQEISASTNKSAEYTEKLSAAIEQVARNAQSVVNQAGVASEAAKLGSNKVNETLQGMQQIKHTVDDSAKKIQVMGKQSEEIGDIVDTIEEIASQTNLLALNAAIEAARAGDAGKGFAVVADEVRKLAERVSTATKDIASLISSIQKVIAESVTSMDQGVKEVDKGVIIANEAGKTLAEILNATQEVNQQAKEAAAAAKQMATNSNDLVNAADSVSTIAEENANAAGKMSENSIDVSKSMESIAAISEENSAAVEEISASAEEMSGHVLEVSNAAQSLSDLATHLQEVVQRFKLN